jgi:transposase-like protein
MYFGQMDLNKLKTNIKNSINSLYSAEKANYCFDSIFRKALKYHDNKDRVSITNEHEWFIQNIFRGEGELLF